MKTISNNQPQEAQTFTPSTPTPQEMPVSTSIAQPSMSLEAVIHYACHVADDNHANSIMQMLMAQYMTQGLCDPQLTRCILTIPEQRKQIQQEEQWQRLHPQGTLDTRRLPPELRTPAAIKIWQALLAEGLVDERCQTLRSRTESGVMAATIARALGIHNVWVTFGTLWGITNLKSAHDKSIDQQKGWDFQSKLDSIIG